MTMQWLVGWWNLIFVTPFALALLYLGVYTLTGLGGDADADAHVDVDADADVDVDADAHVDADGHDADGDSDADADGDTHPSLHTLALTWLGVGRVPITLILIVLLLTWGAAGFVCNALLRPSMGWEVARISIPVALLVGLFVTRGVVLFMGRFVPLNESFAKRRGELVGCVGEAVYAINDRFGIASVRDDRGDLHQVNCRVADGVPAVTKGARVKLVAYGARDRTFFVRKVDAD